MLSMRDQVVLITGAHGGIGAAMVSAFAESDATVIGSDRGSRRPDAAAAYYDFDVTDEAATADVVSDVVSRYGRIDALVHGAGVPGETADPLKTSTAEFERIMSINAGGTFTIVRETARAMPARDTKGPMLLFRRWARGHEDVGSVRRRGWRGCCRCRWSSE
jgi:3-oxoacyl-[acyl-carrier protein] reductase